MPGPCSAGGEDYRWPILRAKLGPILFQLLNVVFISLVQNVLLYWITVPAYVAARAAYKAPLAPSDFVAAGLFLLFFAVEAVADQQMWQYQSAKHALIKAKKPLAGEFKLGFLRTGLFRYCRHPNFAAEVCSPVG